MENPAWRWKKGPQDPRFTLIEKRMRHLYLDCLP